MKLQIGDIYITPDGCKETTTHGNWEIGKFPLDGGVYKAGKKVIDIRKFFAIGDKISGFCNGFFGRDDYELKTCDFISGKAIYFKYENGSGCVLNLEDVEKVFGTLMWSYIECWRVE